MDQQSRYKSEYNQLLNSMSAIGPLFYSFWRASDVLFDESIDVACVTNKNDRVALKVNPKIWDKLSITEKQILIIHEFLHIFLGHIDYRYLASLTTTPAMWRVTNIASDIAINELIIRRFGFSERDFLSMHEKIDQVHKNDGEPTTPCLAKYVFKETPGISTKLCTEEYLQLLLEKAEKDNADLNSMSKDDIAKFFGTITLVESEVSSDQISHCLDEMSIFDVEDLSNLTISQAAKGEEAFQAIIEGNKVTSSNIKDWNTKYAGTSQGGKVVIARKQKLPKPPSISAIVQKAAHSNNKLDFIKDENWVNPDNRSAIPGFKSMPKNSYSFVQREKPEAWFFQDTSGSCTDWAHEFFAAAESIARDWKVKMHCFDTKVYETTLASRKLYGFGGTTFTCIEEWIQGQIKEKGVKYPKMVFVFTDGYGDSVEPEKPKNWHIFIKGGYNSLFPTSCNFYDYEKLSMKKNNIKEAMSK